MVGVNRFSGCVLKVWWLNVVGLSICCVVLMIWMWCCGVWVECLFGLGWG